MLREAMEASSQGAGDSSAKRSSSQESVKVSANLLEELVNQGKQNLQAPWLGFTAFFALALILTLLVFIGDALREAFDPRA